MIIAIEGLHSGKMPVARESGTRTARTVVLGNGKNDDDLTLHLETNNPYNNLSAFQFYLVIKQHKTHNISFMRHTYSIFNAIKPPAIFRIFF